MKASAPSMSDPPPPYAPSAGQQPPPPGMYPNVAIPAQPYPAGYAQPYPPVGGVPQVTQVIVNQGFGPHSMTAVCGNCNQQIVTRTEPVTGLLTWILSCTLLVLGCWFGCCLIPCCVRECQDIEHKCPNCKTHLGLYRRL